TVVSERACSDRLSLSVVVPTYNERENITLLLPRLMATFAGVKCEILVVADSSPDGTGEAVLAIAGEFSNVKLLARKAKNGIGGALRQGYDSAEHDIILSCDADLPFSS